MKKHHYIQLKKKCKYTLKKINEYLIEYNEENSTNIDFHTFFVEILLYSEDDYTNLIAYKAKQEKKKDRSTPKPRKIDQNKLIKYGIGDFKNPEYEKYWNIFTDYNENYLANTSITGKKTLKNYFIFKYNYSEDKAYEESKKISKIIFKKDKNVKAAA